MADEYNVPLSAIVQAIRRFDFGNYGLDDVDPKSKYADWVPELADKVLAAVRKADAKVNK